MSEERSTLALALGLGLIAGLRSMSAPALLSHWMSRRPRRLSGPAARLLASRSASGVFKLLAAGEMIADKTPFVGNRTQPVSLAGRSMMGGLCGAAVAQARGDAVLPAALAGAAAAVCSTFLAFELRSAAGELSRIPDPILGLVEDGIVLAAGSHIAKGV